MGTADPAHYPTSPPAVSGWSLKRFALGLALLIFCSFPQILLGLKTLVFRDFGIFSYPIAYHYRASLWRGEWPLWNPLNNGGLPFLAQWNTLVLYPPSLIYLVLPLPWSLNLFCLLHLFFGGVSCYALVLRWTRNPFAAAISGTIFSFNGFQLSALVWPAIIASLAWTPLVLLCAERAWQEGKQRVCLAGLAGACQMLAGGPEIILLTWLVAGGICLWQLRASNLLPFVRRLITVLLLVSVLSAAQLLPFFQLLQFSQRDESFGGSSWAMPVWGLANFVFPLFRYSTPGAGIYLQPGQLWVASYYLGMAALVLGFLALAKVRTPLIWWLGAMLILGLVLATGDQGLLYGFLRRKFSIFNTLRFPIKFVMLAVMILPILAGYGLAWFLPTARAAPRPARRLLVLISGGILVILAALLAYSFAFPFPDRTAAVANGIGRALFLGLIAGNLLFLVSVQAPHFRAVFELTFLLLCWADLRWHFPNQNPLANLSVYQPGLGRSNSGQTLPSWGNGRIMMEPNAEREFNSTFIPKIEEGYLASRLAFFNNCNLLDEVPKVNGGFPLYLKHYEQVLAALSARPLSFAPGLADFLGITHTTAAGTFYRWLQRSPPLPMVRAGPQPLFLTAPQVLQAFASSNLEPSQVVYLPVEAAVASLAREKAETRLFEETYGNHEIKFEIVADRAAWVTIAQPDYPCWAASVDGRPARLWRANYAFQALEVPPGRHRVRITYRDQAFRGGLMISSLGLAGTLGFAFLWRRRKLGQNLETPGAS